MNLDDEEPPGFFEEFTLSRVRFFAFGSEWHRLGRVTDRGGAGDGHSYGPGPGSAAWLLIQFAHGMATFSGVVGQLSWTIT